MPQGLALDNLISVLVPCRNERQHIDAFCDSALGQRLPTRWPALQRAPGRRWRGAVAAVAAGAGLALDVIGAFQYLDHLEDPAAFVAEVFEHARALLLILDNVDAPVAIQHATGWGRAPLAWLADAHGKRLVDDFAAITPSGNHAWLLCDD